MIINTSCKFKKGFTLVELLVVIAIIGMVIAFSLFGMQKARESARDAKRKSDLESIRSALELYKADYGSYPGTGGTFTFVQIKSDTTVGKELLGTGVTNATTPYLSTLPVDPRYDGSSIFCNTGGTAYGYEIGSDGLKYIIITNNENQSTSQCINWGASCSGWVTCYMVQNP